MKAIVLTYDRNHHITQNMLLAYRSLWPNNPLEFIIPYQEKTIPDAGSNVSFIKTAAPIISTALQLLDEACDSEWIYWSIDDYFPIKIDVVWMEEIILRLDQPEFSDISGINICLNYRRKRYFRNRMLHEGLSVEVLGQRFIENEDYSQMWIPQLFRAGVLKRFFSMLEEPKVGAKELDYQLRQLTKPKSDRLMLSSSDRGVFGESTVGGYYTLDFINSAKKFGISLDQTRIAKVSERSKKLGRMGLGDKFEKWFR